MKILLYGISKDKIPNLAAQVCTNPKLVKPKIKMCARGAKCKPAQTYFGTVQEMLSFRAMYDHLDFEMQNFHLEHPVVVPSFRSNRSMRLIAS